MTTIENEHFDCTKMVSCKVMTIKTQKGIGSIRDIGGLLGGVGDVGSH